MLVLTIFIHALILCIRRGIPPFLSSLSFASSSLSLHAIIVVTDNHFHEVLGGLVMGDGGAVDTSGVPLEQLLDFDSFSVPEFVGEQFKRWIGINCSTFSG